MKRITILFTLLFCIAIHDIQAQACIHCTVSGLKEYIDDVEWSTFYQDGDLCYKYEGETMTWVYVFDKSNTTYINFAFPASPQSTNGYVEYLNNNWVIMKDGSWEWHTKEGVMVCVKLNTDSWDYPIFFIYFKN